MISRKKFQARDQALNDVMKFPNFLAWSTFSPVSRAMVGADNDAKRLAYEAAFEVVLERAAKAAADLEAVK
jgi:hypothetical protein